MSMDKSLVSRGRLRRQRSVLTRAERIERLVEEERWEDRQSVFGLPKVRTIVMHRSKKQQEAADSAEAAEGTAGEAPEKPAKG